MRCSPSARLARTAVAKELGGVVRFGLGDSHTLTFSGIVWLVAAAVRLPRGLDGARRPRAIGCAINIAPHRGRIYAFRSSSAAQDYMLRRRTSAPRPGCSPATRTASS
jgi:hypothetical protein